MKSIDLPPFAPVLMESTRAMGYSLETAIADIVDNSIAASATMVDIDFSPYAAVPYVSILDNGEGMDEQHINDAMRYGSQSSLNARAQTDLGRFGLGLKTASMSQCRCLTVISKQGETVVGRRWDLDEVYTNGTWSLLVLDKKDFDSIPQYTDKLKHQRSGTVVIWEKLDRLLSGAVRTDKLMNAEMEAVREHLSLVFHRYLSGEPGISKLTIKMNGYELQPKDPFLIGKSTVFQAEERYSIENDSVYVSTYILPHVSKLSRKDKENLGGLEGLTKNQGFYIYRNKRLLVWGTWFRMHRKDELSKLARIKVDVPNSLDHLWTLDIRKSTATPPDVIKSNLARIVDRISEGSKRTWTFRGKREVSDNGSHLWTKTISREGVVYNLNREHVYLQMLNQTMTVEQKKALEDYLRLVEGYLPLNQLYVDLNNEEQVNVKKEKEEETDILQMTRENLERIQHLPNRADLIQLMIMTDPFNRYQSVIEMLNKELNQDG